MKRFWMILSLVMVLALGAVLCLFACGESEARLVSISVDSNTLKSTYKVGETPDWESAQLVLTYSDGSTQLAAITPAMLKEAFNSETEGKRSITIVYNNQSYLFNYTVIADAVASHVVSVQLDDVTTSYKLNETMRYDGTLTATFDDGTTQTWALADIRRVLTVSGFRTDRAGNYQCTLSYESSMGTINTTFDYTVAPLAEITSATLTYTQPLTVFMDDTREDFAALLAQYPFALTYADGTEAMVYVQSATAIDRNFNTEQVKQSNSVAVTLTDKEGRSTRVMVQYAVIERYEVYTVTFDPNFDGVLPFAEKTNEATGKIAQQNFDRRGYLCLGWFVDNENGERFDFNTVLTSDMRLVAKWMIQEYYIKATSFGMPYGGTRHYTVEQTVVLDAPVAVNGYNFLYYTYQGTPIVGNTIYPGTWAENLDIVAEWQPIEYAVEYRLHDSAAYPVTNAAEFAAATYTTRDARDLEAPIRPGFTFRGWSTDAAGSNIITTLGNMYGDQVLHANWAANTYYITFVQDVTGEPIVGRANQAFSVNSTDIEIRPATIPGYRFEGWYLDADCQTEFYRQNGVYTLRSGDYTDSFTLYAKTTPVYTLYLASEHTANPTAIVFALNEDRDSAYLNAWKVASTRKACDLVHWAFAGNDDLAALQVSVSDEGEGVQISATCEQLAAYNGQTFEAVWTGHQRTITYKYGDYTRDGVVTFDTYQGTTLEIPTRGGYRFAGWKRNSGLSGTTVTAISSCETDDDQVFYAKWTLLTYTLKLHYMIDDDLLVRKLSGVNTTTAYTVDTVTYTAESENIAFAPNPMATYNNFGGWYTTTDYTGARMSDLPTGSFDITDLYAKWTPTQYGVNFYNAEEKPFQGTLNEQQLQSVNYRTGNLVLYEPTRAGYTFGGWYTDKALTTPYPQENERQYADIGAVFADIGDTLGPDTGIMQYILSVYAKWEAITYTITFSRGSITTATNPNLESGMAGSMTYSADNVVVLKDAIANGYTFLGWFTKSTGGEKATSTERLYQSIDLYPQWQKATYSIAYDGYTDEQVAALNLPTSYQLSGTYANSVNAIKTSMTRFGYTLDLFLDSEFAGTAITALGSASPDGGAKPYCADVTVYAKWTPINYTLQAQYKNATASGFSSYTNPDWGSNKTTLTVEDIGVSGYALPVLQVTGYKAQSLWYTASNLSISLGDSLSMEEFSTYVNKNNNTLTIYAPFEAATYNIIYQCNLQEGVTLPQAEEDTTYTYFLAKTLPTIAAPDGYKFEGWYLEESFDTAITQIAAKTYSGDLILYGRMERLYSITYDYQGAAALSNPVAQFTNATDITLPEATHATYKFSGWLLDGVNIGTLLSTASLNKNVTITPLFYYKSKSDTDSSNISTAKLSLQYSADGTHGVVTGYTGTTTSCVLPNKMGTIKMFEDSAAKDVTEIGASAFANSVISGVTIPDTYTVIGNYAFAGSKLSTITLPEGITTIGEGICRQCAALTSATINGGTISADSYLFEQCGKLTTVTLNNCTVAADSHLFYQCTKLTTVTLNCDNVGLRALSDCTALVTLYTKGDVCLATLFDTPGGNVMAPATFTTLRITGTTLGASFGDSIDKITSVTTVYLSSATQVDVTSIEGFLSTRKICVPNALLSAYKAAYPNWNIVKI